MRIVGYLWVVTFVLLGVSCQVAPPSTPPLNGSELAQAQRSDWSTLKHIESHNAGLQKSLVSLKSRGGWGTRGYFTAQESDELEHLLSRFHNSYLLLIEIVDRHHHGAFGKEVSVVSKAESQKLGSQAQQQLMGQARLMVNTFDGDPVAIAKLNQRFPRSEIPRQTYDKLADLLRSNVGRRFYKLGQKLEVGWDESSYELQVELIKQVGRFKNPRAHLMFFSEAKKREVLRQLEPGDILLTYTAGYASTIFIPGAFKHAMVYVGSLDERRAMGLVPGKVSGFGSQASRRKFDAHLIQGKTSDGQPANIIEAIFVGVKLSNLEFTMDTHMNRMVVLRPRLTLSDRRKYLAQVFSYLGQEYDFRFDFADASRQVCTETVYRALNGLNGINLVPAKHNGHLTVSSDDIVNYWLHEHPSAFEFVMFVDEKPLSPNHAARIRTGKKGVRGLKKLMSQ